MNKIQLAIISLAFVATTASAEHVYQGLSDDNPDLGERHQVTDTPAMPTAGSGTEHFDMHHGLAGNPDLSPPPQTADGTTHVGTSGGLMDVHHGLSAGNPDLSPPPER